MRGRCGDREDRALEEVLALSRWEPERRCSFCGLEEAEAGPLIGGEHAYLCEGCLDACNRVLEADRERRKERILATLPAPRTILGQLDDYVIGQQRAKKVLAVAVYNHYKRLVAAARGQDVEVGKSNVLLIGPTGCGKSHLAQCLARSVEVPFVSVDATALTGAGYAGEDAEGVVERLLAACDYEPERAARGIVYIDELDKIAARGAAAGGPDVSGEGAQQALLRLLEGREVRAAGPRGGEVRVDTRHVLFICGGAFEGLDAVASEPAGVGFTAALGREASRASDGGGIGPALRAYGLLPELVGRLPLVEELEGLGTAELERILTEPRNAVLSQYRAMLARDGCDLEVTEAGLRALAERARQRGAGARALRAVLEEILLEPMFAVPAADGRISRLVIDRDTVHGGAPRYEWAGEPLREVG